MWFKSLISALISTPLDSLMGQSFKEQFQINSSMSVQGAIHDRDYILKLWVNGTSICIPTFISNYLSEPILLV